MTEVGSKMERRRLLIFSGLATAVVVVLLYFFQIILVPFLIASFFSFLLLPVVDWVEKKLPFGRAFTVIAVIVVVIAAISGVVAVIVPVVRSEVISVANMLPAAKEYVMANWIPWLRELVIQYELVEISAFDKFVREFRIASQFGEPTQALQRVMNQTSGVLGGVFNTVLIPVFGFFLLKDITIVKIGFEKLVPLDLLPVVRRFGTDVDLTLKLVVKRQLTVAAVLGVLYMLGFAVIGLPSAFAIGAIAGACRVVNYGDVVIGVPLALVAIITSPAGFGWGLILGVTIIFVVVQSLDGMLITPRIIGGRVGLHPGIVIASIFAFGDWLGFGGILIAIPFVAVLKIVLQSGFRAYRDSAFFAGPRFGAVTKQV